MSRSSSPRDNQSSLTMQQVAYYPLPLTDHEAFADKAIVKALKRGGFEKDPASDYYVVSPTTGAAFALLGSHEVAMGLTDENWDILRAMDKRCRRVHERRLFPYDSDDAAEHGRQVVRGHEAYNSWYDMRNGFYDSRAIPEARAESGILATFLLAPLARTGHGIFEFARGLLS